MMEIIITENTNVFERAIGINLLMKRNLYTLSCLSLWQKPRRWGKNSEEFRCDEKAAI